MKQPRAATGTREAASGRLSFVVDEERRKGRNLKVRPFRV
jgi:hypothetical protein